MLKYTDYEIVFEEIPDEVTLAINISNCPNHCPGCHSPYLRDDIGEELYGDTLVEMIEKNDGITCVCFMGEGRDEEHLFFLVDTIKHIFPHLKIALYTGGDDVSPFLWDKLDYIKLGPYVEELGPLNMSTTNQRLYKREKSTSPIEINGTNRYNWRDITSKFWRTKA